MGEDMVMEGFDMGRENNIQIGLGIRKFCIWELDDFIS